MVEFEENEENVVFGRNSEFMEKFAHLGGENMIKERNFRWLR